MAPPARPACPPRKLDAQHSSCPWGCHFAAPLQKLTYRPSVSSHVVSWAASDLDGRRECLREHGRSGGWRDRDFFGCASRLASSGNCAVATRKRTIQTQENQSRSSRSPDLPVTSRGIWENRSGSECSGRHQHAIGQRDLETTRKFLQMGCDWAAPGNVMNPEGLRWGCPASARYGQYMRFSVGCQTSPLGRSNTGLPPFSTSSFLR